MDEIDLRQKFLLILIFTVSRSALGYSEDATQSFRGLFTRHNNKRLSSIQADFVSNVTLDVCTGECVAATRFQCKSFSYDNNRRSCFLYAVNLNDPDVHLVDVEGRDHYETSYLKQFARLPSHEVRVTTSQSIDSISPEECARRCILETRFKCRGFNYQRVVGQPVRCLLVESNPATGSQAAMKDEATDFYQKETEGAISSFINYGMGMLQPMITSEVYQRSVRGVTAEGCAQRCLDETTFDCWSFDYVHEDDSRQNICHLSQYIAANVQGLVVDTVNPRHNHFERIERFLNYFYATPYAVIQGNNIKTFTKVTPNRCARLCMEEDAFVCRSFDYRVVPEATCLLSSKTSRDVGGLDTVSEYVHHFEMKPLLDCGGNLTEPEGGFASPNWPRNYAHHENCVWNITTSRNKIIELRFTHFDLGLQSSDQCSDEDDRLMVTDSGYRPYCVKRNTKTVTTKTNSVSLQFLSNADVDAQGFRAFYRAEWTCNMLLKESPGEFASPKWPENYPPGSRCAWRITAPEGQRVRIVFTSFALEHHVLGHCNEKLDHVRILDGGTVGSSLIGLYCGSRPPFSVVSSGQDVLVQFTSDTDPQTSRPGFHAKFVFEVTNGSISDKDSRFINIGGGGEASRWQGTEEEDTRVVGSMLSSEDLLSARDDSTSSGFRSAMWAVVTCLLLLVVALAVALFLVIRHYRRKINGETEMSIDEDDSYPTESVPLQSIESSFHKNQFNNRVDLNGGAEAVAASCMRTSRNGDAATTFEEEKLPSASTALTHPRPPPRLHRPQSSYGKYHDDNVKNINVEDKTQV